MHLVAYAFYDSLYTLLHGCIEAFTAILGNPHDVISTIVDAMRGFPVHIFYTLNLHLVYFIVTIGLKPTGFRTQGQRRNDAGLGLRAFRSRRLALKSLRPGFRTQDMEINYLKGWVNDSKTKISKKYSDESDLWGVKILRL